MLFFFTILTMILNYVCYFNQSIIVFDYYHYHHHYYYYYQ